MEEVAKTWKRNKGSYIVEGDGEGLQEILKVVEGSMRGGRVIPQPSLSAETNVIPARHSADLQVSGNAIDKQPFSLHSGNSHVSLPAMDWDEDEDTSLDPRKWLRVVGAFEQPRLSYNPDQKHFEKRAKAASLLPNPSHKAAAFRDRYNSVHQRILRNESFQVPAIAQSRARGLQRSLSITQQQAYKITPVANLLGRSGSSHVLLGLLTTSPTGSPAISDLTGNVTLDLSRAKQVPENGSWFCPGMIVIVEGVYEEDGSMEGLRLGGGAGVGGTIGGKFVAASIGGPPGERRQVSLGTGDVAPESENSSGGGFGWVDFLGVGNERACGPKMRLVERRLLGTGAISRGRGRIVCLGELTLDKPETLQAIRQILKLYAAERAEDVPMAFVLAGNFSTHAAMASGKEDGSIEYKESFDLLASVLSDYPTILQAANFVFVPGDNDPWASSFSKGAATVIPRKGIPDLFTSRIKRSFTAANGEADRIPASEMDGEVVWTSNPARISLFGPVQEVVVFRDDISTRLQRSAMNFRTRKGTGDLGESFPQGSPDGPTTPADGGNEDGDLDMMAAEAEQAVRAAEHAPRQDVQMARKLVKTILDQGYLSPFPISSRPVLWDWVSSLQLYPLPSALFLIDAEAAPFAVTYEGCHVINTGKLVAEARKNVAQWAEYDVRARRGAVREITF